MSTIAEVSLPGSEFALHETLEAHPDVEFEIERMVAHETDRVMPFVWATSERIDRETLDETMADDPSVDNVTRLAAYDGEWFYRMEWVTDIRVVLHVLLEQGATVLNASGRNDVWELRILFPDRDSLSATYDYCTEEELTLTVNRIHELDGEHRDEYGLTETQHETLVAAVEAGYFDIPQQATLDELADDLGITHQALSERLHRGHKTLIENALIIGRMGR
ncbi:helix-turn-helix domain-containing protein [Halococcus hamelinensis]|uniref:DNA binding domain-containing protein n=1 Tax=Halococcus hamelinensis 100A6 TaxID=1132509 RepID=M0M0R5_9EURY|nr:bacterio-opsin activator domain-containing protein [Halococcus hamelinensis]EMA39271.1 DNA binding domain-containing protein [Halococcus hamelinensis 100A6]